MKLLSLPYADDEGDDDDNEDYDISYFGQPHLLTKTEDKPQTGACASTILWCYQRLLSLFSLSLSCVFASIFVYLMMSTPPKRCPSPSLSLPHTHNHLLVSFASCSWFLSLVEARVRASSSLSWSSGWIAVIIGSTQDATNCH